MKITRYLIAGAFALSLVACEGLAFSVDSKGRVVAEYQLPPPKAVEASSK